MMNIVNSLCWLVLFLTPDPVGLRLHELEAAHPQLRVVQLGMSVEGRPLWGARLGTAGPGLAVLCGQHGEEEDTTALGLELVEAALREPPAGQLLVVPRLDPDRRTRQNAHGVDLNRNWDVHWAQGVSDPTSDHYRGPSPFSEPETRAMRNALQSWRDLSVVVDVHTGEGSFVQGCVHYPHGDRAMRERAQLLAHRLDDPTDPRAPFLVASVAEYRDALLAVAPAALRPQLETALPPGLSAPGACLDWVAQELHVDALALEIARPIRTSRYWPALRALLPAAASPETGSAGEAASPP